MASFQIYRRNPKSGIMEQPYRDRQGHFVLADPAGGAQRHQSRYAVKVKTTAEAVAYLEQGWPIRMTDGQSPPSLVSARSVMVTPVEIEGEDETGLGSTASRTPLPSKEVLMDELKLLLCAQAGHIALAGSAEAGVAFMGFESDDIYHPYDIRMEEWKKVDLSRFKITRLMSLAFDFAYQCGEYWMFELNEAQELKVFINGIPRSDAVGYSYPALTQDGLCWRIAETAFARWSLGDRNAVSVRELSLLANITESATRTSLSREGLSAPDGTLSDEQALAWLKGRRGFIPTRSQSSARKDETIFWSESAFRQFGLAEALTRLISKWKNTTPEEIRRAAKVDQAFMDALMAGRPVPDLDALQRVGNALEIDVPQFVGFAVQEAFRAKEMKMTARSLSEEATLKGGN